MSIRLHGQLHGDLMGISGPKVEFDSKKIEIESMESMLRKITRLADFEAAVKSLLPGDHLH